MREAVLAKFAALRRRYLWVRGVDLFLEIAFVMTVTVGAMLLVDRLVFELKWAAPHLSRPGFVVATLAGAIVMSALLAVGYLIARPASPAALAWQADRALGGEERFLTSLEIAAGSTDGGLGKLLLADAARRPMEPKRVLPRVPIGYRWAIALTLLTGGVLMAYPPEVWPAPKAALRAMPLRGAAPLDVRFEDLSQGAIDSWNWDFGDGGKGSGEAVTHRFEQPGRYSTTLSLEGPGGRSSAEVSIEVLPAGSPVADFEAEPRKGRAPLSVAFKNTSQNAQRFEWDFGDGSKSDERDPRHVYAKPGEYGVTLKISNQLGEDRTSRPNFIRVLADDAPLADFRAHPREGPAPLAVLFEDLSSGKVDTWEWDFGDQYAGKERFGEGRSATHVYRMPGTYTVSLRTKGPGGEDTMEKVAYIRVGNEGNNKGGGQGGGSQGGMNATGAGGRPTRPGARQGPGDQPGGNPFGDKTDRPPVKLTPETVGVRSEERERVPREMKIYQNKPGSQDDPKYEDVYPAYRRQAEDTMRREKIPPGLQEYVKRFYDRVQPK